jgi:hypothetical protein
MALLQKLWDVAWDQRERRSHFYKRPVRVSTANVKSSTAGYGEHHSPPLEHA